MGDLDSAMMRGIMSDVKRESEAEVIRTPDSRTPPEADAREAIRSGRTRPLSPYRRRNTPGQGALWRPRETYHAPAPVLGGYPDGFLAWAARLLACRRPELLHICSGGLPQGEGLRIDLRPDARPDVLADGRALPFATASFPAALLDPPYSVEYAQDLYGTDYPRPSHLLAEAARVVQPCGRIGILHFLVPSCPPGCSLLEIRGVTTGMGYRIRALTIYQKHQEGLW